MPGGVLLLPDVFFGTVEAFRPPTGYPRCRIVVDFGAPRHARSNPPEFPLTGSASCPIPPHHNLCLFPASVSAGGPPSWSCCSRPRWSSGRKFTSPAMPRGKSWLVQHAAAAGAGAVRLVDVLLAPDLGEKWAGVGYVAAAIAFFFGVVRLDGFDGVMHPRFSWRWSQTAEQRAAAHRKPARRNSPRKFARHGTQRCTRGHPRTHAPSVTDPAVAAASPSPPASLVAGPDDSPEFRGVRRDGVVTGWRVRPEIVSGTAPKPLWRQPIGPAWSGFAVVGEFAFTQEQREADECVVCLEAATGREVWVHADPIRFEEVPSGVGPRATPTVVDGRVYTVGGTALLNCLDARTGKTVCGPCRCSTNRWSKPPVGARPRPLSSGTTWSSPSPARGPRGSRSRECGGRTARARIRPHHRQTIWSGGTGPGSYAAPARGTLLGREQLFVFGGTHLQGLDPQSGKVLWTFPWTNTPRSMPRFNPIDDATLVIGSGYGTGAARLRFDGSTTLGRSPPSGSRPT